MASESLTEAEKLSEREVHEKTIAETLGTMYTGLYYPCRACIVWF
jgi:hypothetical protein